MKKKYKICIAALCLLALVPLVIACAKTVSTGIALHRASNGSVTTSKPIEVLTEKEACDAGKNVRDDGNIIYKNVLVVDGEKNYLLCMFEDPAAAMKNEKRINAQFHQLMQKKWGLAELSDSNWKDYQQKLIPYTAGALPDDLGGEAMYDQYMHLRNFLEIYEDGQKNSHALNYVSFANEALKSGKISRISLDPIEDALPYDSPIAHEYSNWTRTDKSASR